MYLSNCLRNCAIIPKDQPGRFPLAHFRSESGSELLDGLASEAGQPCVKHQGDERDEGLVIGTHCQVRLHAERCELTEWGCLQM